MGGDLMLKTNKYYMNILNDEINKFYHGGNVFDKVILEENDIKHDIAYGYSTIKVLLEICLLLMSAIILSYLSNYSILSIILIILSIVASIFIAINGKTHRFSIKNNYILIMNGQSVYSINIKDIQKFAILAVTYGRSYNYFIIYIDKTNNQLHKVDISYFANIKKINTILTRIAFDADTFTNISRL